MALLVKIVVVVVVVLIVVVAVMIGFVVKYCFGHGGVDYGV